MGCLLDVTIREWWDLGKEQEICRYFASTLIFNLWLLRICVIMKTIMKITDSPMLLFS